MSSLLEHYRGAKEEDEVNVPTSSLTYKSSSGIYGIPHKIDRAALSILLLGGYVCRWVSMAFLYILGRVGVFLFRACASVCYFVSSHCHSFQVVAVLRKKDEKMSSNLCTPL